MGQGQRSRGLRSKVDLEGQGQRSQVKNRDFRSHLTALQVMFNQGQGSWISVKAGLKVCDIGRWACAKRQVAFLSRDLDF